MKQFSAMVCVFLLLAVNVVQSANKYFNYGPGTNTWDTVSNFWGTASGGPYDSPWVANDDAIFEGTSGTVALSAGQAAKSLTFSTDGYTITGSSLTLTNPATVTSAANDGTISSAVAGTAGLGKTGSGTLTLSGVNTYSGATTINNGTLRLAAPTTSLSGIPGLFIRLDANNVTGSGNPTNGATITSWANLAGSGSFTGAGALYNPTAFTMNGQPVVHFTGNVFTNFTSLGTNVTIMYVGRLTGGANARLVGSANINWLLGYIGGYQNEAYFNGWVYDPHGAVNYCGNLYEGIIPGAGQNSSLYQNDVLSAANQGGVSGPGILALGGGNGGLGEASYGDIGELLVFTNVLTGVQRIQAEQYLQAKWQGDMPVTSAVNLTASNAVFDLNGVSQQIGSLAGVGGSKVVLNGGVLSVGLDGTSTTFSGLIDGGSVVGSGLIKNGTGVLTLNGSASNTYTGMTVVASGKLGLSMTGGVYAISGNITGINNASPNLFTTVNNQFAPGSVLYFAGNEGDHLRFELLGTTQTLAGVDNSAASTRGLIQHRENAPPAQISATSTLILNGAGSYSFNGYLRDYNGGSMRVVKNGSGTQTFGGGNISYTGGTTLNSGVLNFTEGNKNIGGGIILNGGALNQLGTGYITVAGFLNVAVDSTITVNNSGASNPLFFDGGVTGTANLTITNIGVVATGVHFRNGTPGLFTGNLTVNGGHIASQGNGFNFQNSNVTLNNTSWYMDGTQFATTGANEQVGSLNGNGNMLIGVYTLTIGNGNKSGSFSGVVSGTGTLAKIGAGTQVLSGTNTFTGTTTVNGGMLKVNGTLAAGSGATVNAGGLLGGTGTVSGSVVVATSGGITPGDSGVGAITVGNLTLSAGSVNVFEFDPAATNDLIVVTTSGGLTNNGGSFLLYSNGTVNAWVPTVGSTYNLIRYSGAIAGTGPFSIANPVPGYTYTFTTNGANVAVTIGTATTWTGGSASNNLWQTPENWGGVAPSNGAALVFDGGIRTVNTNDFAAGSLFSMLFANTAGAFTLSGNSITLGGDVINVSTNAQVINAPLVLPTARTFDTTNRVMTVNGILSGAGGVSKSGAGTLTLNGNNTYTGNTAVNSGVLVLNAPSYNTYSSGTISINNGSVLQISQSGGSGRYDFGSKTFAFDSNGGGAITTGTGLNFVFMGANTFSTGGGAQNVMNGASGVNMNGQSIVFALTRGTGVSDLKVMLSMGNSGGGLTLNGNGILELAAGNAYTGATTINGGTLVVTGGVAIADSSAVTLANTAGAVLQLNASEIIGSLAGGGAAGGVVNLQGFACTNGGNNTSTTFGGAINGAGNVVKTGTGTLTLSGVSASPGSLTVNSGAVNLSGGQWNGTVQVNAGGTLGGAGSVLSAGTTVADGGSLKPGSSTLGGVLRCSDLTLGSGTNTFTLSDTAVGGVSNSLVTVTNAFTVNNSVIAINPLRVLPAGLYTLFLYTNAPGGVGFNTNIVGNLTRSVWTLTNTANAVCLNVAGGSGSLRWDPTASTNWDVGASSNWLDGVTKAVFFNNDSVMFDDGGAVINPLVSLIGTLNPLTLTVSNTLAYTFAGNGTLSSGGPLFKTGTGTLTLTDAPNVTCPIVNSNGAVVFNTVAANSTINQVLSGGGAFGKTGPAQLTLNANSTYSGATTASGGTLYLASNYLQVSASVTMSNSTLQLTSEGQGGGSPTYGYGINNLTLNGCTLIGTGGGTGDSAFELTKLVTIMGSSAVNRTGGSYYRVSRLTGGIAGAGTLTLYVPDGDDSILIQGDTSGFSGTAVVSSGNGGGVSIQASHGWGVGSTLIVNKSVWVNNGSGTLLTSPRYGQANVSSDVNEPTSRLVVNAGGVFNTAANIIVGSLSGPGGTIAASAAKVLMVGALGNADTFAGVITGVGALGKNGTGTLTLTGNNSYTAGTTVSNGVLLVDNVTGFGTGTGAVAVVGGTLGGTGTIAGAVSVAPVGTVAPGDAGINAGIGTLTITSNVLFQSGSVFAVQISSNGLADKLVSSMTVSNLGATLSVSLVSSNMPAGTRFTLMAASNIVGTFNGLPEGASFGMGGRRFAISYPGNTNVVLQSMATGTLLLVE